MPAYHSSPRAGVSQRLKPLRHRQATITSAALDAAAARFWRAADAQFERFNEAFWERQELEYGKMLFESWEASLPDTPEKQNFADFHYAQGEAKVPAQTLTALAAELAKRSVPFWKRLQNDAPSEVLDPAVAFAFLEPGFSGADQGGIQAVHALALHHDWLYNHKIPTDHRTLEAAREALSSAQFASYRQMLERWARRGQRRQL